MELHVFINVVLLFLFGGLVIAIAKTKRDSVILKEQGQRRYEYLQGQIKAEKYIEYKNAQKLALLDTAYSSFVTRLFEITKQILSIQKLIFE